MNGFYPITAQTAARRRASSSSSAVPALASPGLPAAATPSYGYGAYGQDHHLTESPQSSTSPRMPYSPRTPTLTTAAYARSRGEAGSGLSQTGEVSGTDAEREREFPTVSQGSRAPLLDGIKERDYAEAPAASSGPSRASRHRGPNRDKGGVKQGQGEGYGADSDTDDDPYIFIDPPDPDPLSSPSAFARRTPHHHSPLVDRNAPAGSLPAKQATLDPSLLPRPGPADAYISRFLAPFPGSPIAGRTQPPSPEPLAPGSSTRPPAPPRSSSAPGAPFLPLPHGSGPALTAAGAGAGSKGAAAGAGAGAGDESDHPLFRIFSAQLDTPAEEMVRRLKGHLGQVLRVQEEVGEMHLRLEGLGTGQSQGEEGPSVEGGDTGDAVQRREKGVEEIMKRLGTLSDSLRSYHTLGTPKLSFPPSASASASASRSSSAFPPSPVGPLVPPPDHSASQPSTQAQAQTQAQTQAQAQAQAETMHHPLRSRPRHTTSHTAPFGGAAGDAAASSAKLRHKPSIENKRIQRLVPSSPGPGPGPGPIQDMSRQQRHSPKVPSNLDQVTTADEADSSDDRPPGRPRGAVGEIGKGAEYGGDKSKGQEAWLEQGGPKSSVRDRVGYLGSDAGYRQGFTSSPMEMADRSRPW